MKRILFVCHGNICRSPMAEFLMKDYVAKHGKSAEYCIDSKATSSEEIGNGVHYGTKRILDSLGIDSNGKRASRISKDDYDKFDYIVVMDRNNLFNIARIGGKFAEDSEHKIHLLSEYFGEMRDVADPWYTGDFTTTYNDIKKGTEALYSYLESDDKNKG